MIKPTVGYEVYDDNHLAPMSETLTLVRKSYQLANEMIVSCGSPDGCRLDVTGGLTTNQWEEYLSWLHDIEHVKHDIFKVFLVMFDRPEKLYIDIILSEDIKIPVNILNLEKVAEDCYKCQVVLAAD